MNIGSFTLIAPDTQQIRSVGTIGKNDQNIINKNPYFPDSFSSINFNLLFRFLKYGLGVLLAFIGTKMLFHHFMVETLGIDNQKSLLIIGIILGTSILLSLIFKAPEEQTES